MYSVQADCNNVGAPIGSGFAGAVAWGDAPAIKCNSHIVGADADSHTCT